MPQSLSQIRLHLVFSTKNRERWIDSAVRAGLHAYLAGACRAIGSEVYVMPRWGLGIRTVRALQEAAKSLLGNRGKSENKYFCAMDNQSQRRKIVKPRIYADGRRFFRKPFVKPSLSCP